MRMLDQITHSERQSPHTLVRWRTSPVRPLKTRDEAGDKPTLSEHPTRKLYT